MHRMDDGIWGWEWKVENRRSQGQWPESEPSVCRLSCIAETDSSFLGPSLNPCGIFLPKVWFLATHILHNFKKLDF